MRSLALTVGLTVVFATVGLGLAATTATAHGVVITGQVTDGEGNPVDGAAVLVQPAGAGILENATDGEQSIGKRLRSIANDPPVGLRVNRSVADGRFKVHVAYRGDYAIQAVSNDGVSRRHSVTVRYLETRQNLTVDADRIQRLRTSDAGVAAGETATVRIHLRNTDDEAVRNVTIRVGTLPTGWTIAAVTSNGSADAEARRLRWEQIPAGGAASTTIRFAVPDRATAGTQVIEVAAESESHFVEHGDDIRIRVGPSSRTPTPTATSTEDGLVRLGSATPDGGGINPLLVVGIGVFLVGMGISGYAVWRAGMPGG